MRWIGVVVAKPVLQHHAHGHTGGAAARDQFGRAGGRDVERLFHEHVLPGPCAGEADIAMGVGRREHGNRIDAGVVEDGIQAVAGRERKSRREELAARSTRAEGVGHLHIVREIHEPFCMGRDGHAEADDRDARLPHSFPSETPGCRGPVPATDNMPNVGANVTSMSTAKPGRGLRTPLDPPA